MKRALLLLAGLVVWFGLAAPVSAGTISHDLEIILDASGSMRGKIQGRTKMAIAEETLVKLAGELAKRADLAAAIRVYGHQFHRKEKNCRDSKLEIPFGRIDPARIKALLKRIKPRGYTPLAYSIGQARIDFDCKADRSRTIILITDGLETCDGDPCQVARQMADDGVGVIIHVVGFGLKKGEAAKLKCLTEPSGGLLLEAANAGELIAALNKVVKKALNHNLVVKAVSGDGKPLWAHTAVFKAGTGQRLALRQGSTTRFSLPAGRYDVEVREFKSDQVKKLTKVEVKDGQVTGEGGRLRFGPGGDDLQDQSRGQVEPRVRRDLADRERPGEGPQGNLHHRQAPGVHRPGRDLPPGGPVEPVGRKTYYRQRGRRAGPGGDQGDRLWPGQAEDRGQGQIRGDRSGDDRDMAVGTGPTGRIEHEIQ